MWLRPNGIARLFAIFALSVLAAPLLVLSCVLGWLRSLALSAADPLMQAAERLMVE